MIVIRINGINSQSVGVCSNEIFNITFTRFWINQRIIVFSIWIRIIRNCRNRTRSILLISNTSNQELGTIVGVEEFVTDNFNRRETSSNLAKAKEDKAVKVSNDLSIEIILRNIYVDKDCSKEY